MHTCSASSRAKDDCGAVLVYVAIALAALAGFGAIVIDFGVFLTARAQAQNVVDAAALGAAVAFAYDTPANEANALESGRAAAAPNRIWGQPGALELTAVGGRGFMAACPDPVTATLPFRGYCARARVYRDQGHNNPLPTYLAGLFGLTTQSVKATALAASLPSNATTCMRAFVVWPVIGGINEYRYETNFGASVGGLTVFDASATIPGSYRFYNQSGVPIGSQQEAVARMLACTNRVFSLGEDIGGGFDASVTPFAGDAIVEAVNHLIYDLNDETAMWNGSQVVGSCVARHDCMKYDETGQNRLSDPTATVSPRIIVLPIVDKDSPGRISNFLPVFVEGVSGTQITGRIVSRSGVLLTDPSIPSIDTKIGFLRNVALLK